MKTFGTLILAIGLAVVAVVLWPAPNPLQGVETVALEDVPESVSFLINDSVLTIGNDRFTISNDPSQADAVITFHSIEGFQGGFEISSTSGVRANAHLVLDVEKDGQRSIMDLYIELNNDDLSARLEGRKFYEVWKYPLTQQ